MPEHSTSRRTSASAGAAGSDRMRLKWQSPTKSRRVLPPPQAQQQTQQGGGGILGGLGDLLGGGARRSRQSVAEAAVTSAARAIGSNLGRQIVRGVLGSLLGGKR